MRKCNDSGKLLKGIFITVGVLASLAALLAVAYTLFKKYFKITFECDDDCEECGCCCDECDEDSVVEPICCCDDCEEADDEEEA